MAHINEDGNLIGRIGALAVLGALTYWFYRFLCCCP
jgi:hypothetical protein